MDVDKFTTLTILSHGMSFSQCFRFIQAVFNHFVQKGRIHIFIFEKFQIHVLDFEKNIVEIEAKIESLKQLAADQDVDISQEVQRLQQKLEKQVKSSYSNLSPWEKSQVARHPNRPHCLDYVNALVEDFTPLCGDRLFADDEAMIGGIGRFKNISVVVLGQEKGHDLETRMKYNFGMAKPEGYRKAQRLMEMANKFNLPVICFVDTAGAFPGHFLIFLRTKWFIETTYLRQCFVHCV